MIKENLLQNLKNHFPFDLGLKFLKLEKNQYFLSEIKPQVSFKG